MSPAFLRPLAAEDLVERARYYRAAGGDALGHRFFDAATRALRSIERQPTAGSPLVGEICDIPGLRSRPVPGFPVSWLYFVADERVDVVRLLAHRQDLPAILQGSAELGDAPRTATLEQEVVDLSEFAGEATGAYSPTELDDLRDEWR